MLRLMIVEDDVRLSETLKYLIEDNPRYRVVGTADDLDSAVSLASAERPDLALVDLRLARGSTGFSVAVHLQSLDVPCLFVSGKAPDFPMPDLALGCLMKPFTADEVHRAIALAEDKMRGREALRARIPSNLTVYDEVECDPAVVEAEEPAFIPSRRSLLNRLEQWIARRNEPTI